MRKEHSQITKASEAPDTNRFQRILGRKHYELTNQLGNVLITITDRKKAVQGTGGLIDHWLPEVVSYTDYFPFGMIMPGRSFSSGSYRYGYQGQEKDDEIKGEGNSVNYKYRMHDPRLGRFFAVDPLAASYPYNSPYAFSENRVIDAIELEGLEKVLVVDQDERPDDDGTSGETYTGDLYYLNEETGDVFGPYEGSTYPNSKSNTDNSTNYNTVNTGTYNYNNATGHKGSTKKGLNLVDANGNRNTPGTDPDGNRITMQYVNVHDGASDNGNYNSRGSAGCITCNPNNTDDFFNNFNWTSPNTNTGNSKGTIRIVRADEVGQKAAVDALYREGALIKAENYIESEDADPEMIRFLEHSFGL